MPREYIGLDAVVVSLTIKNASHTDGDAKGLPRSAVLRRRLRAICQPPPDELIILNGQAYNPIYASSDGLATGCSWTNSGDGGGVGQVVVAPVGQLDARIRVGFKLAVAKDADTAWLTIESNPTSMRLGHNIHPAAWSNPETGVEVAYPSSDWDAMSDTFRLGFEFAVEVGGEGLFDAETKLAIERGDFHLVRVQWAATKGVKAVTQFLQLLTVVYDPTIARGSGIISNATHLGLDFEPFIDPETHHVTGVLFRKLHGRKLVFSVSLYDKQVRWAQMQRDLGFLTEAQAVTVKESVREDITAHSEGVVLIAKKAQKQLEKWGPEGLKFFDFLAPEEFLSKDPKPTFWWLQRAVYILSHFRERGKFKRYSFGVWLVPYIEDDVLHFDVIAGITADGLHRMRGLRDPVAEAWRKVRVETGENWADRLAQAAKCSTSTVYNRRDLWRNEIGIDIEFPPQLVIDVLHFGQASTARPENVGKMLAAVKAEDGEGLLRLYTEALADFEHKRVTILNPALLARPRYMPLEAPPSGPLELDDGGDEPADLDLMEIDLLEEASVSDPEAWRSLTPVKTTPPAPLVKATSKLGKKSTKFQVAAPPKLGRPKPRSSS
jgi:hypothetical protein